MLTAWTPSISGFDTAGTAGTRSNLGGYYQYWQYSGVCTSDILLPLWAVLYCMAANSILSYCEYSQHRSTYLRYFHYTPKFDVTYTEVIICATCCCVPPSECCSELSMQSRTDHPLAASEERHDRTFPDCLLYRKEVVWLLRSPSEIPINNTESGVQNRRQCEYNIYAVCGFCIQPSAIQSLIRDWERTSNVKESDKWNWKQLTNRISETRLTGNWKLSYTINAAGKRKAEASLRTESTLSNEPDSKGDEEKMPKKWAWGRFHYVSVKRK